MKHDLKDKIYTIAESKFDFLPYQKCFIEGVVYTLHNLDDEILDKIIQLSKQWEENTTQTERNDFIRQELNLFLDKENDCSYNNW